MLGVGEYSKEQRMWGEAERCGKQGGQVKKNGGSSKEGGLERGPLSTHISTLKEFLMIVSFNGRISTGKWSSQTVLDTSLLSAIALL